jgi:hypothetical protein
MEKNGFQFVPPKAVGLIYVAGAHKDGCGDTVLRENRLSNFEVI